MASLNRDVSTLASGPGAIGAPSDRISDQPKSARSGPPPREILDWAIATWNRVCGGKLSPVVKITDARRAAFLKRWREDFHEDAQAWEQFCARVAASQFLTNSERKNRADWKANFDFVIEPRNLARIVEGQWDTPPPAKPRGKFDWLDDPPDLADTDPPPEFDLEMTPDADGTYRPH
jgi:hypothetical protein